MTPACPEVILSTSSSSDSDARSIVTPDPPQAEPCFAGYVVWTASVSTTSGSVSSGSSGCARDCSYAITLLMSMDSSGITVREDAFTTTTEPKVSAVIDATVMMLSLACISRFAQKCRNHLLNPKSACFLMPTNMKTSRCQFNRLYYPCITVYGIYGFSQRSSSPRISGKTPRLRLKMPCMWAMAMP